MITYAEIVVAKSGNVLVTVPDEAGIPLGSPVSLLFQDGNMLIHSGDKRIGLIEGVSPELAESVKKAGSIKLAEVGDGGKMVVHRGVTTK